MNDKLLSFLGLMRRAGKLEMGFDAAKESILKGKSKLLITAGAISPKTLKELKFFAEKDKNIQIISTDYTEEDFEMAVGKKIRVLSITDQGFAEKAAEMLNIK